MQRYLEDEVSFSNFFVPYHFAIVFCDSNQAFIDQWPWTKAYYTVMYKCTTGFPVASSEKSPWLFHAAFPWLRDTYFTLKCWAQRGEKILAEKVHWNQVWNLVHFSQSKIPWLSLTLNKIPWLSLTFQKNIFSLILPDAGNPGTNW